MVMGPEFSGLVSGLWLINPLGSSVPGLVYPWLNPWWEHKLSAKPPQCEWNDRLDITLCVWIGFARRLDIPIDRATIRLFTVCSPIS
ncbi:hypothetical protein BDV32DRAFT_120922 [Aspergillus pseudonomiae]|nr:hypothetical protein BDV32DRAFT_120922 [Aspergillus pseudonomiae]